jgi:hypothetical protein
VEEVDITPAVAAALVAAQFPQWADLALVVIANILEVHCDSRS